MKRSILAFAIALTACGPDTPAPSSASTPAAPVVAAADRVILTGARAFAAAELGYITAARGVGVLADRGVITGSTAAQVRAWNAEARALLIRGKATADAVEKARVAAALFGIADRLGALNGSR